MFSSLSACLGFKQKLSVLDLEIEDLVGDGPAVDESIQYLISKHKDIQSVKIYSSDCTDKALSHLLALKKLRTLSIDDSRITGDQLITATTSTDNDDDGSNEDSLEELSLRWSSLTGTGLANILRVIGGQSLTLLDLSETRVTMDTVSQLTNSFPRLKVKRI